MNSLVQKYAKTGVVTISIANPKLDGTGAVSSVITADAAAQGTKITSLVIKATGSTSQGMIRFFIQSGTGITLFKEVNVPANVQSPVNPAFQCTLYPGLSLNQNETILVATQNAEIFNVIAGGYSWTNCPDTNTVTCSTSQAVARTALINITVPNPSLNGGGAISPLITGASGALSFGTDVNYVYVKAAASTSQGMIRTFLTFGVNNYLLWETPVPVTTQTGTTPAFATRIAAFRSLAPGAGLSFSTQNGEPFNILTFAADVTNCACPV